MSAKDSCKQEIREMDTSTLIERLATYAAIEHLVWSGGRRLTQDDHKLRAALRTELNERIAARR